jgi:protein TonB
MFDAVLQRGIPRRQLGPGAVISIAVHAGVLVAALYVSAGPRAVDKQDAAVLHFVMPAPPPPPLPAKASEASKAKSEPKRPTAPKDAVVPTKPVPPKAVEEASNAPSSDQASHGEGPGTAGGSPGTGDPNGRPGGEPGGQPAASSTAVLPMLPGMERPSILVRGPLTYSREAMAASSEGVALARCVVNLDGSLSDCRITKSVPFMDRPILEMLQSTRYSCVMYQGHCQRVEMVIPVHVAPPR